MPRRVLFVEDEPELRDAYRRYFGKRFDVRLAATGAEAFQLLDDVVPDLVILDMRLPDTDGIEVLQYVRERYPDLPVLITTAYASTQPVLDVLGLGHSGFLLKPYTLSELEERIDAVVAAVEGASCPGVFYVYDATDPTKPWTAGPGSFADALIGLAGGENIAGQADGPWVQFSLEQLVNADPEIILVDSMHGTAVTSPSEMKEIAAWQGITAVREDRICPIDGDLVNLPGPRIVEGLEEMAKIIHPELFND